MDSEETRTNGSRTDSTETTNVVRIPRDWFGPKDDLVPFGPRARSGAGEASEEGRDPGRAAEAPLDAETFWGETADSVHDILDEDLAANGGPSARGGDRRTLMAAVLVLLMAGAGLATWVLGSTQRGAIHPKIASITDEPGTGVGRVLKEDAASARRARSPFSSRRPTLNSRSVAARSTHPTQVVYRTIQPIASGSSSSTADTTASMDASVASPRASDSSAPPPTSSSHASQPAFGASGALGPMSSPAG